VNRQLHQASQIPSRRAFVAGPDLEEHLRARKPEPRNEAAKEGGAFTETMPGIQHAAVEQFEVGRVLQVVAGQPRR
jgi:hypothetical protein